MTRFEKELSGALGAYWKKSAEKELEKVKEELEKGLITIDENGVARNRIGRVLMSDMLEKLTYVTDAVDTEATTKASTGKTQDLRPRKSSTRCGRPSVPVRRW